MSVLLCLPYDLHNYVCSSWVDLRTLAFLDTAVCQRNIRPILLNQLKSKTTLYEGLEYCLKLDFFTWLRCRNVHLSRVLIDEFTMQFIDHIWKDWGCLNLGTVDTLCITDVHDQYRPQIVLMLNECSSLKTLRISKSPFEGFDWNECPNILSNLTSFQNTYINFGYNVMPNMISTYIAVAQQCNSLQQLSIQSTPFTNEIVSQIFENNPNLKSMEVVGPQSLLDDITKYCKHIDTLEFYDSWRFVSPNCLNIIEENCKKKNFYFKYDKLEDTDGPRIIYKTYGNGYASLYLRNIFEFELITNLSKFANELKINRLTDEIVEYLKSHNNGSIEHIIDYNASILTVSGFQHLAQLDLCTLQLRNVSVTGEDFFCAFIDYQTYSLQSLLVSLSSFSLLSIIAVLKSNCQLYEVIVQGNVEDIHKWKSLKKCLDRKAQALNIKCILRTSKFIYFGYENDKLMCLNLYGNMHEIDDELSCGMND